MRLEPIDTKRPDKVVEVEGNLLQHGPNSDRVYLMHLGSDEPGNVSGVAQAMVDLAKRNGYGKLFAKVPEQAEETFLSSGFHEEARVPGMFPGGADGCFLSRFLDPGRAVSENPAQLDQVLEVALEKEPAPAPALQDGFELAELGPQRAEEMAGAYAEVFDSYPFPIMNPDFLRRNMECDVRVFAVLREGEIAALSAAEMCPEEKNVEMTDFATLPGFRGLGLAGTLLEHMEGEMARAGFTTAYTIARAASFGMNVVFSRAEYAHAGTLVNNTQIAGSLESMNVWHKPLGKVGESVV